MLTVREAQALRLAAEGMCQKNVALEMHVSLETVKTTLRSGRQRLGARNTTHAVALAWRQGLIR